MLYSTEANINDLNLDLAFTSLEKAQEMDAPIEDLRSAIEQFTFLMQNDFEKDIIMKVLSSFRLNSEEK